MHFTFYHKSFIITLMNLFSDNSPVFGIRALFTDIMFHESLSRVKQTEHTYGHGPKLFYKYPLSLFWPFIQNTLSLAFILPRYMVVRRKRRYRSRKHRGLSQNFSGTLSIPSASAFFKLSAVDLTVALAGPSLSNQITRWAASRSLSQHPCLLQSVSSPPSYY